MAMVTNEQGNSRLTYGHAQYQNPSRLYLILGGLVLGTAVITTQLWWGPLLQSLALLQDQQAISTQLRAYGAWGPLFLALAQWLQVLIAVIPGHVFLVAAGYVYGFPVGFILNFTFIVAASQFSYFLARFAGRPLVNRFVSPTKIDHWQQIAEKQGFTFFTIAFLLPVFPTDAMNFVAGLSGLSSRKFLAANAIGRLPSAIILTLIGSHGLELSNSTWVTIAIFAAIVFVSGRISINRIQKSQS